MCLPNAQALVRGIAAGDLITAAAEKLAAVHGTVVLRREKNGIHAYMACPKCLELNRKETRSRHLAVNLEKYLRLGVYAAPVGMGRKEGRNNKKGYAQCMKMHGRFEMSELLAYSPISERVPGLFAQVLDQVTDRYLVPDDNGNMVPDGPGKVRRLSQLPYDHPALVYLRSRDYEPAWLDYQFGLLWCDEEAPEDRRIGRFYRKHPGDWKSTPQGRIIFNSLVGGVRLCWQGRYLEIEPVPGVRLVWHPYRAKWEPRPLWAKGEEPVKYNTALGAYRNESLCGWDSAVERHRLVADVPTCVLTEGPLDAARFPDCGLAALGKSVSPTQILLIKQVFKRVVLAFDWDAPGRKAAASVEADLKEGGLEVRRFFDGEFYGDAAEKVDAGKLGYQVCRERLAALVAGWGTH